MLKTDTTEGEKHSASIKHRTSLHTLSTIPDIINVSNELSKNLSL